MSSIIKGLRVIILTIVMSMFGGIIALAVNFEAYGSNISLTFDQPTSYVAKFYTWTSTTETVDSISADVSIFKNNKLVRSISNTEYNTYVTEVRGQERTSSLSSASWDLIGFHSYWLGDTLNTRFSEDSHFYNAQ